MDMNGYYLVDAASDTTITADRKYFLEWGAFSDQEPQTATQAAADWSMTYYLEWICCARSDNGIDDRKVEKPTSRPIHPEQVVLRDGRAVGVFMESHLFLFEDPATHKYANRRDLGYEGGWGDITEIDHYLLKKKL